MPLALTSKERFALTMIAALVVLGLIGYAL
ncbi:MAG: hypothetical protein RL324_1441 [Verrucomicrobiota bacterium]|jgi:hypothetical protein